MQMDYKIMLNTVRLLLFKQPLKFTEEKSVAVRGTSTVSFCWFLIARVIMGDSEASVEARRLGANVTRHDQRLTR